MKKITDSFSAKGDDGKIYTVEVWTNFVTFQGSQLPGSYEYMLSNGNELLDVPGRDDQWEIESNSTIITKI